MSGIHALIARRHDTAPIAQSQGARTTTRLPEELVSEQVQRLSVFAAVAATMWTFGLFMDTVVLPSATASINWRAIPIEITAAFGAGAMWLYLRLSASSPSTKVDVGLGFMLLNAVSIAMLNAWAMPLPDSRDMHLSWMTILILVYSMIAPTDPQRMLFASLAAAAMDPLAYSLAHLAGLPTPSPVAVVVMTWPTFACAVIAMLPSRILQRIGRRLREAQDMGSYHLEELLGTGGMGQVWRARHRLLARDSAIKLVRPEVLGARSEADAKLLLRRFEREAQATAQLSSPHTINLFDFGITDDNTFYYVMELLSGRDLESLVREFGPLPWPRALYLLRQVSHSLADAHARGLVHRDIKPANIYVCRMGREYDFVKVLDFGLVKFKGTGNSADSLATLDQTTTGTPAYMAPETILGDTDVDRRADVYTLGCVAYYLLTGHLVFEADTPMKMLMQHLNVEPAPPSSRTELPIPRELDELVLRCLQKDPNRRPQNAEELLGLTHHCCVESTWTQEDAQTWWAAHLPEFAGPLTIATTPESPRETVRA